MGVVVFSVVVKLAQNNRITKISVYQNELFGKPMKKYLALAKPAVAASVSN